MRRRPTFMVLLVAMFLELIIAPLFMTTRFGLPAARLVGGLVLLAALDVVGLRRPALLLAVPTLIAHVVGTYTGAPSAIAFAALLRFLFLSYVVVLILRHAFNRQEVDREALAAAVCAYLLLGMIWAPLYLLVEYLHPGSLSIPDTWLVSGGDRQAAFMYFSFVTLTTVGYGDIKPVEPAVGGLCIAEALVGQLYVAIMIARLVGLHIAGDRR